MAWTRVVPEEVWEVIRIWVFFKGKVNRIEQNENETREKEESGMSPSCCIGLLGLHNKVPQMGGFSNRNILFHGSVGLAKFNVSAELVPSEGCEGESVPSLSPSFWWFLGRLWHSLTCKSITLFIFTQHSLCVCLCPNFLFLIRTPIILD